MESVDSVEVVSLIRFNKAKFSSSIKEAGIGGVDGSLSVSALDELKGSTSCSGAEEGGGGTEEGTSSTTSEETNSPNNTIRRSRSRTKRAAAAAATSADSTTYSSQRRPQIRLEDVPIAEVARIYQQHSRFHYLELRYYFEVLFILNF
jgi:hypothetical protein